MTNREGTHDLANKELSDRQLIESEIDEEIEYHLAARTQALEEAGLGGSVARRTALQRFGDRRKIRQACLLQRHRRPIMLQRLHLATTVLLLLAAGILGARSLQAQATYESRLAELSNTVALLSPPAAVEPHVAQRLDFMHIAVGDTLQVIDPRHKEDVNGVFVVARDGMILLPEVGWMKVAEKTLDQIDREINQAFVPMRTEPPTIVTALLRAAPVRTPPDATFTIAPGDTLRIFDEFHPLDINLSQEIRPDGTLLLPEIGRIHVAGYTRSDIEKVLSERFFAFYTTAPQVRVSISKPEVYPETLQVSPLPSAAAGARPATR